MRVGVSDGPTDADRVGFGAVAHGADVRPMNDQVLILQDDYGDPDEVSAGGIVIGGLASELPPMLRGQVLAVGPGPWNQKSGRRVPINLEPGEFVQWPRAFGTLLERLPGDRRQRLLVKAEFLAFAEETSK